jgi:pimeloyl-ACP methyl ester carboxylesterase
MSFKWGSAEAQSITIDGVSLECASWGASPDKAPTIVLLHEGLGCVAMWKDFPQKLALKTGFGVFAYSRAGYGGSDPATLPRPIDYMPLEAKNTLPKVLDQIGFQRGILLGHSDGATIAACYGASVSDQRIRGLILMAPHFFTEEMGLSAIAKAKAAYDAGDLKNRLAKYHKNVDIAFRGWNDVWLDPKFKDMNVADCIDHWRIPVLAIQGQEDQYGTLAQIDEIEARIYSPLDVAILEQCGHAPHFEQPQKTLKVIVDFTATLERLEHEQVVTAGV